MTPKQKILITGGAGSCGKYWTASLLERGHEVRVIDKDVTSLQAIQNNRLTLIRSGVEGTGPVMMAVEILPTELPRESSAYFSGILKGFVPALAAPNYDDAYDALALPPELKRAVICHRGELTPDYRFIETHLSAVESKGSPAVKE